MLFKFKQKKNSLICKIISFLSCNTTATITKTKTERKKRNNKTDSNQEKKNNTNFEFFSLFFCILFLELKNWKNQFNLDIVRPATILQARNLVVNGMIYDSLPPVRNYVKRLLLEKCRNKHSCLSSQSCWFKKKEKSSIILNESLQWSQEMKWKKIQTKYTY